MKKTKPTLSILAILLLFILLSPFSKPALAANEIDTARTAGQIFINSTNIVGMHPSWQNASLDVGKSCFNLDNTVISYLFAIKKNDKVAGRIVVGSSIYNYRVLEASEAPSPVIPDMSELINAVQRDLGMEVTGTPTDLSKPLYIGYCGVYASYEINGKPVAFDLWRRKAILISQLNTFIATPKL